jgi:hypothetical protein
VGSLKRKAHKGGIIREPWVPLKEKLIREGS